MDNDITWRGKAIPITCVRVVVTKKVDKNSYKRVYTGNGFLNLKILKKLLHRKGEMYSKGMDQTRSSKGNKKDPAKFLIDVYRDKIMPVLEEKVMHSFSE